MAIFSLKEFTKKNFSSKFQFSAKVMMAPPGGQTVTKKFWLVVNSEILKGIKNMFGLFEHFFRVSYMFKPTVRLSTMANACGAYSKRCKTVSIEKHRVNSYMCIVSKVVVILHSQLQHHINNIWREQQLHRPLLT